MIMIVTNCRGIPIQAGKLQKEKESYEDKSNDEVDELFRAGRGETNSVRAY